MAKFLQRPKSLISFSNKSISNFLSYNRYFCELYASYRQNSKSKKDFKNILRMTVPHYYYYYKKNDLILTRTIQ